MCLFIGIFYLFRVGGILRIGFSDPCPGVVVLVFVLRIDLITEFIVMDGNVTRDFFVLQIFLLL